MDTIAEKPTAPAAAASLTGRLMISTSHAIRTSLNSIAGMAQLISDTELTREQCSYLDTIQQSTRALFKTLNYVLDISETETAPRDSSDAAVDLHALCQDIISAFHRSASDRKIRLSCSSAENVPLSVVADSHLIEHVLSNCLDIVMAEARDGSAAALNISCGGKDLNGARIAIELAASGCILDEDSLKTAEAADGSEPGGKQNSGPHGIALAISKHLAEVMGGTLELDSTPKAGTTFTLHLTLPQASRPAPIRLPDMDRGDRIVKPNLRILLAEDNKVNQTAAATMLRKAGCSVDTADNGKCALKLFCSAQEEYDLVLMDCEMPLMDGYEATTHIREMDEPHGLIPVIALTANAMAQDRKRCLDCGMNDYLPKPVSRRALIKLINKYTA